MLLFEPPAAGRLFDDLASLTPLRNWHQWPEPEQLAAQLATSVHFLSATVHRYESHIFQYGQVPTRYGNWHDLYNALIWSLFAASKQAMNAAHMAAMDTGQGRGPRRDALTLFDECGLLLVADSAEVFTELNGHQWQSLFWRRRQQWLTGTIRPYLFGHALYESLHHPYAGLCGKVLGVVVDADFGQLSLAERYRRLDQQLAQAITAGHLLTTPRRLSPLPLLGIPGVVSENADADYYSGEQFRPLRQPRPGFDCLDLRDQP